MMCQLQLDILRFLSPYLRNVTLSKSVGVLYKSLVKHFLLLLHDFGEMLAEFYYVLLDITPLNANQLRNIILSAYPRNISRPPDPSVPNLRFETELPDPVIYRSAPSDLVRNDIFRTKLEAYLTTRNGAEILAELKTALLNKPTATAGGASAASTDRYNLQLLNGLVLFVALHAIQALRVHAGSASGGGTLASILSDRHRLVTLTLAHTDVFETLASQLDSEGRYLLFVCMVNHLRYPNLHTLYFSSMLLHLFCLTTPPNPMVREQLARAVVERVLYGRPYPWGVVYTLLELVRDPQHQFMSLEFVRFHPEIERCAFITDRL